MRHIKKLIPNDRALFYLRGCNPFQFADRVTKLVGDCLDQINEFYNVLSTVEDGKDGKDGEQGPMGPAGPAGPIGPKGNNGIGVPSGGNVGQYLKKKSNSDYDTEWSDVQGGGSGNVNSVNGKTGDIVLNANDVDALPSNTPLFSGDYNDLGNKPTIPSALSQLNEDASHRVVTDVEKTTWNNKSNFSGSYNDLSNKPTIPTTLSQLSEDSTHRVVSDTEKTAWNNKSNFSGSYNDLTDKPTIPDVPTNVSAFNNDAGYLTEHQDISGKEDMTTIVAPVNATDATLPVTSLTCDVGKYYRLDVPVETLAVTLPAITDSTTVRTVVIYLTGGTTPAVTITSTAIEGGVAPNVYYQDGYEIESGKTYEVNCLWNGVAWVIASVEIVVPTNEGE